MSSVELLDLIQDKLSNALYYGDLENGVKWLNEKAHEDFIRHYPYLNKAIGEIMDIVLDE